MLDSQMKLLESNNHYTNSSIKLHITVWWLAGFEILGAARRGARAAPRQRQQNWKISTRRASAGKIFLAKGIFIKLYEHALKPVLLSRNNAGKSPKNDPFYSFIHFNTHMLCKNSHFRAISKFWRAAPRQRRKIWKSWRAAPRQAPEILKCWRAAPRQRH